MPRTQDDIDINNLNPVIPVKRDEGYENPFDVVECPLGVMERWRANAMAMGTTGAMSALHEMYQVVRNDAAEVAARADAVRARRGLIQHLCDQISGMQERITRLEDALEARHKADAEREEQKRQFEEEPLSEPPGTVGPSVAADDRRDDEPPGISQHPGELPEPSLELEDELGDLPEALRDLPDPVEPPRGSVVPQPVSISLTEE
jgi:hypothetical protein